MGADTLSNHMRIHCDGPSLSDFNADAAIDAYVLESPGGGWRHIHGHKQRVMKARKASSSVIVIDEDSSSANDGSDSDLE